jgi:hypothetical protein
MTKARAMTSTNGARHPNCETSSAPILGAMTGATVKIIVISDISLAAALPLEISRTMARDSTIAGAAPMPCTKRPASMVSMEFAVADAIAPIANKPRPT